MPCFFLCAKMLRTTLLGGTTILVLLALGGLLSPVPALGAGPLPPGARPWDNPYQPHSPRAWSPPQAPETPQSPPAPSVPSAPMDPAMSAQGGIYNGMDPHTGDQIIVVTPMPGSPVAPQAPQYMPIYPQIFPTYPQQPVVPPPLPRQQSWQPPFVYRPNPARPSRPFIPGQSRPPFVYRPTPSTPSLPPGVIPGAPMRPARPGPPPGWPGFVPQPRR